MTRAQFVNGYNRARSLAARCGGTQLPPLTVKKIEVPEAEMCGCGGSNEIYHAGWTSCGWCGGVISAASEVVVGEQSFIL